MPTRWPDIPVRPHRQRVGCDRCRRPVMCPVFEWRPHPPPIPDRLGFAFYCGFCMGYLFGDLDRRTLRPMTDPLGPNPPTMRIGVPE